MDIGLLLLRLGLGALLMAHGGQKLFSWFGGYGIKGTGQFMESLGMRPGHVMATMAGLAEFGGGLLIALGFLTPFASAAVIATMLVATFTVHIEKGFFATNGGYELPFLIAVAACAIAFIGPGIISVDNALRIDMWGVGPGVLALALGLLGGGGALAMRALGRRDRATVP